MTDLGHGETLFIYFIYTTHSKKDIKKNNTTYVRYKVNSKIARKLI